MKFRFRIDKTRVYRAFLPTEGIAFTDWFYNEYLYGKPYCFDALEDETHIQFRLFSKEDAEKEAVRQFLIRTLTQFKERFIGIYLSELQAKYVDPESPDFKEVQGFLNKFIYNHRGEAVRTLYSVLEDIRTEFMSFDLMILPPDDDVLKGKSKVEEMQKNEPLDDFFFENEAGYIDFTNLSEPIEGDI